MTDSVPDPDDEYLDERAAYWITHALPKIPGRLRSERRPSFITDQDVDALAAVTEVVLADTGSKAWDRMLAWRAGRAAIIARHATVLDAPPEPDTDDAAERLALAVIENAWHQQGRPQLDGWDRYSDFGGDQAAAAAFEALVVASRSMADDESSPTDLAEASVQTLSELPQFVWAL